MFHNANELKNKKTEEQDHRSLSSVPVPGAGLFYEPFLNDLDLIWRVDPHIDGLEQKGFNYA